jgi:hypothetical protein
MYQDHLEPLPTSPYSSTMTHHQAMSTDSFSPILHSSCSQVTDDTYQTSCPVNESDEIIRRNYYSPEPAILGYDDEEGTSLWADLDRDGVNTPAIPSFILNSPPMGPNLMGGNEYPEMLLYKERHPDVTIHALRKGATFLIHLLIQAKIQNSSSATAP